MRPIICKVDRFVVWNHEAALFVDGVHLKKLKDVIRAAYRDFPIPSIEESGLPEEQTRHMLNSLQVRVRRAIWLIDSKINRSITQWILDKAVGRLSTFCLHRRLSTFHLCYDGVFRRVIGMDVFGVPTYELDVQPSKVSYIPIEPHVMIPVQPNSPIEFSPLTPPAPIPGVSDRALRVAHKQMNKECRNQ